VRVVSPFPAVTQRTACHAKGAYDLKPTRSDRLWKRGQQTCDPV